MAIALADYFDGVAPPGRGEKPRLGHPGAESPRFF